MGRSSLEGDGGPAFDRRISVDGCLGAGSVEQLPGPLGVRGFALPGGLPQSIRVAAGEFLNAVAENRSAEHRGRHRGRLAHQRRRPGR